MSYPDQELSLKEPPICPYFEPRKDFYERHERDVESVKEILEREGSI
ncbi:hypothetical protein IPA_07300 [Ignicoccus pacificus DSM 13166]|uniref:Uncharacterized protein n=1 Tax=Ignicoccus pacificus DSM 13166 TaxID=940294 RepID=A0A977PLN1_9CREN|nr:hypothetical protein IPA_07300 [Ignicoccus pacificus DSM 13166]